MIILTPSNEQLDHIPTISYLTLFLLFFSALKFLLSGKDIIEEGYRKVRFEINYLSDLYILTTLYTMTLSQSSILEVYGTSPC